MWQQREGVGLAYMNIESNRKKMKEARLKKKLRQHQVAKAISVSQTFYNQIERGERNPRLETALKVSDLLEIDVKDWY
jgi:DNA-binding XRE family transcriptional regulator